MLGIILGFISLVLSILLAVAIHSNFSFDIMSFSLFFILPVGSIFIGTIACLGFYWGLFIRNKKLNSLWVIIGLLIPIMAYIGTQYGYYATAYLDDDMNLNYKMVGEHISNFAIGDSDEPLNFFSFTKLSVESRVISFSRRARPIGEIEGNAAVNWIFFIIDGLGSIFGTLIAAGIVIRKTKYCDDCKRYMKFRSIFKIPANDLDRVIRCQDIDNLSPDKIKQLFSAITSDTEEHYEVFIHWCQDCSNGHLEMQYMERDSKGKMTENDRKSKEFKISSNTVKLLLEFAS